MIFDFSHTILKREDVYVSSQQDNLQLIPGIDNLWHLKMVEKKERENGFHTDDGSSRGKGIESFVLT